MIAHHSIIFKPESRKAWVSSNPYQLGEYVAYDLNAIFSKKENDFVVLGTNSLNIPKDGFLDSEAYRNYEKYKAQSKIIDKAIAEKETLDDAFITAYQNLNPDFWMVYDKAGQYYFGKRRYIAAQAEFEKALAKEITTVPDRIRIEKCLKKIRRRK